MAARGLPRVARRAGDVIDGLETPPRTPDVDVLHAGTARRRRRPRGHRRRPGARRGRHRRRTSPPPAPRPTPAVGRSRFDGAQHRTDIAARQLTALTERDHRRRDASPTSSPPATPRADLAAIWSPEHKIVLERRLWIAVLEAQRDLGVDVPDGVVEAYETVVDKVDLDSIAARERVTRHDVKARIEEFTALAGHEHIHKGMTSRDLTENVEQLQVRAVPASWSATGRSPRSPGWPGCAAEHADAGDGRPLATTSPRRPPRSASGSPPSPTSCWSRCERLEDLLARYPLRGIKGPIGTAQDMLDLLDGDAAKLAELEQRVAAHLGFDRVLTSVGQVYPRSLDFDVVSALVQLVAGAVQPGHHDPADGRPRAGHRGLPAEGQVGSSAMPHKMNTRSCERVNGLAVVLRGYLSMVGELAGDQWNEGDVSCSVVRRVALPDAFFAADGLFETFLTVLDEFGAFPAVIAARARPLPAVPRHHQGADGRGPQRRRPRDRARGDQGARGRRRARDARAGRRRATTCSTGSPPTRGSGLSREQLDALVADPLTFTGAAGAQVAAVVAPRRRGRRRATRTPRPTRPRRSSDRAIGSERAVAAALGAALLVETLLVVRAVVLLQHLEGDVRPLEGAGDHRPARQVGAAPRLRVPERRDAGTPWSSGRRPARSRRPGRAPVGDRLHDHVVEERRVAHQPGAAVDAQRVAAAGHEDR